MPLRWLTWADVSFDTGAVHVRKQLGRDGKRAAPKTEAAVRRLPWYEEPLRELRAWRLASAHSLPGDFVACTRTGQPLDHRTVGRALETAVERAGLDVEGLPKLTPHSLRKIYSSAVEDAMRSEQASRTLSRSMGHSNLATTYGVYVHDYVGDEQDERTRALQRRAFGGVLCGDSASAQRSGRGTSASQTS